MKFILFHFALKWKFECETGLIVYTENQIVIHCKGGSIGISLPYGQLGVKPFSIWLIKHTAEAEIGLNSFCTRNIMQNVLEKERV